MKRTLFTFALLGVVVGCGKGPVATETAHGTEPAHEEAGHEKVEHEEAGHGDVELTPEGIKAAGIRVLPIALRPFQAEVRVPGVIASTPGGRALVTPPVAGRVLRLLAAPGDAVRQGQSLAILESVELAERATTVAEADRAIRTAQAEVSRAGAELRLANGRLVSAQGVLNRQRELARTGAFSQPSLQVAERDLNSAQADLESAQREAVVHRAQLERSERLFRQELVSRIELENARLDVEKDRIAQERATREIEIARVAYERERQIGRRGLLNAREVQAAEADVRAARLEIGRATIAIRSAKATVDGERGAARDARAAYAALRGNGNQAEGGRLTIVAPMSGRVAHREVSAGQAVERTTELFEIDDPRAVSVVAQVPERGIVGLRPGATITVTTSAQPGRRFAGTITTLGGRLDPKTRTLPVTGLIANEDGALRPEMFAEVSLGKGGERSSLAVPSSAVFEDGGKSYVYIEESPGKYGRRAVVLGATKGADIEIVGGLQAGSRVVVDGVFTLRSQAQKDELKGHED